MEGGALQVTVIVAPFAAADLKHIWAWNANRHGSDHADEYLRFLNRHINNLAVDHARGTAVANSSGRRYVTARLPRRGHGHVIVYHVSGTEVVVEGVFHAAQDWLTALDDRD